MKLFLPATIIICIVSSSIFPSRASVSFLDADLNEVREMAGEKGRLYFAFFTADWCAPCHWMEAQTFQNHDLSSYIQQYYLAVKVDIDQRNGRVHQERYGVKMLPTILIFNAQGQLLQKVETAISGPDLLQLLKQQNLPKNRIGSTKFAFSASENVLESPKPALRVYRPPLPAGNTGPGSADGPQKLPPPVIIESDPVPAASLSTQASLNHPVREELAPRSEQQFSILVSTYENYDAAVRQVGHLEAGFKEPVRIFSGKDDNNERTYRIYIGIFSEKNAAEKYLYYLRRKNMNGIVKDLTRD